MNVYNSLLSLNWREHSMDSELSSQSSYDRRSRPVRHLSSPNASESMVTIFKVSRSNHSALSTRSARVPLKYVVSIGCHSHTNSLISLAERLSDGKPPRTMCDTTPTIVYLRPLSIWLRSSPHRAVVRSRRIVIRDSPRASFTTRYDISYIRMAATL